ncbi:MAG: hypothetical protein K0R58_15 [Ramlibacter sp.]|jgi:hypothetical protein|nr:hypothetical protein [Ramlibacter sp.]
MKIESDGTSATLQIEGTFTASELEALLVKLAVLRSGMTPPVPQTRPDPATDPDKPILLEDGAAVTAALRRDGGVRIWMRNRGYGWMGYQVEPARAVGLAKYILSKVSGPGVDLFGDGDGHRH